MLFEETIDHNRNLLPCDGTVNYFGPIYQPDQASQLFYELLHNIQWKHDVSMMFGKRITTKRKVAWYGDTNFEYTYSNVSRVALPWTEALLSIRKQVESITSESYNSCLLNLYHNGEEGVSWHSDGEPDLKRNGAIASVSFGASRRFCFKHKNLDDKLTIMLNHGDLLVMKGKTQQFWLHAIPKMKRVSGSRISLTFRSIVK